MGTEGVSKVSTILATTSTLHTNPPSQASQALIQKQTSFRSLKMTTPLLVYDDRDSSIVYSANWRQSGTNGEYMQTTTHTDVAGETANLTFIGEVLHFFSTDDH